jgi:protease-4
MSFFKNTFSSFIGASAAILITGGFLYFLFIVLLLGGLVDALESAEGGTGDAVNKTNTVLTIDMSAPITERSSEEGSFSLNGFDSNSSIGLRDFVQTLEKAAADENVEGIYLNFESVPVAPSTLTDVRAALETFKSSGKWIVSWSEGMTLGGLYVASVADELFMHPNGYADISGMRLQTTYYTGMLEKMGVGMTVLRGPDNEYKSAVEPFTRKSMSESNREQLNALLDDIWSEVRSGIATGRRIDAQQLDEIAENLLLRTAEDGMNLEIFDGLLYQDELKDRLKE